MKYHFIPPKGWMNDPNGTIYIDGVYHLFYQYYPDGRIWGPMHWGHAVSKDLVEWEHKPIALYPDELGYIFSGSCIYDKDNVSGLGDENHAPLIAMYTSHNPDTGEQQQSIAYSLDFEHFTAYEGNPVIANTRDMDSFEKEYRDPKIFENPILGGYSMALAVDRIIEFYHSVDLIHWEKTGDFAPGEKGFDGMCECPDCFSIRISDETDEETGDIKEKWILSISMILDADKVGIPVADKGYTNSHVMQYFVGCFDGRTFIDEQGYEKPLILDYGTDNYAMVSFANTEDRLMIGWGENWDYVNHTPAKKSRGRMSCTRRLELVKTPKGYRLRQKPYNIEPAHYAVNNGESIELRTVNGGSLVISVTDDEISVDRSEAVPEKLYGKDENADYVHMCAKRITGGVCNIDIVEDDGYYEIFADSGLETFSVMTYTRGKVFGVGVGPGDPEHMTLKALRILKECDVIAIPSSDKTNCTAYNIVCKADRSLSDKEVIEINIPMTKDMVVLEAAYREGADKLEKLLDEGKSVAFLNLGDPTIYGSYMYIHHMITDDGYGAEIINGISSFTAVAAGLESSVGERDSCIHILPMNYSTDKLYDELKAYAENGDTVIMMKPSGDILKLVDILSKLEAEALVKAEAVINCGMEDEIIVKDIKNMPDKPGYFVTVIIKACR